MWQINLTQEAISRKKECQSACIFYLQFCHSNQELASLLSFAIFQCVNSFNEISSFRSITEAFFFLPVRNQDHLILTLELNFSQMNFPFRENEIRRLGMPINSKFIKSTLLLLRHRKLYIPSVFLQFSKTAKSLCSILTLYFQGIMIKEVK